MNGELTSLCDRHQFCDHEEGTPVPIPTPPLPTCDASDAMREQAVREDNLVGSC